MANGTLNNTFAFSGTGSLYLLSTNDDDPVIQWNATGGTSYDVQLKTATPSADRTITLPLLTGNDEVTFNSHTQTLINKTLTAPLSTNQKVGGKNLGGFVQDSASNELLEFDRVASAVNHVKISNTATGNFPKIEATGGDTNVSLNLAS